jgi:hypothetical protein
MEPRQVDAVERQKELDDPSEQENVTRAEKASKRGLHDQEY